MGLFISKIWSRLFDSDSQYKIIIVGLANAGKTTILYHLHLGRVVSTQPTIGSNVEEVTSRNVQMQVWDLGGQETLRSAWSTYYENTNAVIFVIDSTDTKSIITSKVELHNILKDDALKNTFVLIFANKQDLPEAMKEAEISELWSLHEIKSHEWHLQSCSATTGEGLKEGMEWLTERLIAKSGKRR
eukprot:TRINITY_DN10555_c0_g1_i2.p1 TRINITY_DN10555_c0_g1~~TRINITY_DN10555_c0_g1_i2.p1  ORF type:complete len:187 (+),score=17.02 TRINITY_DN10555_c0_g1_i2:63-623(+)